LIQDCVLDQTHANDEGLLKWAFNS